MISRYFNETNFDRMQKDFQFLGKIIQSFKGELVFSLRDNYFNLYFRGNNAARVRFGRDGKYKVEIHEKFYPRSLEGDDRFSYSVSGSDRVIETTAAFLHPLLQKSHLNDIYLKIKKVNYSEELNFEQMLITDNSNRDDLILIDRQVTDRILRGIMDLLALKQVAGNKYQLSILELKMGNNPELKGKVASQLSDYVEHVRNHFLDYKNCYERQYSQKKALGLIENPAWESIEIVEGVEGMIVVGGYSGIAKEQIDILKTNYPALKVQPFVYKIDSD